MMSSYSSLSPAERQQLLLEAVVDYAIYWLRPSGHIESWNPGGRRIKGFEAHEVLGQHFRMFFPPENQETADQLLVEAAENGRVEAEGWPSARMVPGSGPLLSSMQSMTRIAS